MTNKTKTTSLSPVDPARADDPRATHRIEREIDVATIVEMESATGPRVTYAADADAEPEDIESDAPATKSDVSAWETVTTYVATFPMGNQPDGACDVEVQIGEASGAWYVRTQDDAGGSDDAPDIAYPTREQAERAALAFAVAHDEGEGDDDTAADYLARRADREVDE